MLPGTTVINAKMLVHQACISQGSRETLHLQYLKYHNTAIISSSEAFCFIFLVFKTDSFLVSKQSSGKWYHSSLVKILEMQSCGRALIEVFPLCLICFVFLFCKVFKPCLCYYMKYAGIFEKHHSRVFPMLLSHIDFFFSIITT